MESGNEAYSPNTHWIEEREVEVLSQNLHS